MLFSIDSRGGQRKKHNLLQHVYGHHGRVSFKGQIFSAPMNWNDTLEQLRNMEANESHVTLTVQGAVLAARVRISIKAGLVDLNRLIRQATIRRNIVVQLIRMHRDAGHPDYVGIDMHDVERRAQTLASSDEPCIPNELAEFFEVGSEEEKEDFIGVDKAATPAERIHSDADLLREFERARPLALMAQRDSDVNKDIAASRTSALGMFSELELRTGSDLIQQFKSSYIPRVFCMTFPRCVGGPDFPQQPRDRRRFDDAPAVSLHTFTAMMAARCEYQFRADWDLSPGLFSLSFATKVNLGMSMSIQRALRRGAHSAEEDMKAGAAAARIYTLLWEGEYLDYAGRRRHISGDITKIPYAIGLSATEKALLQNYHFMSSRIPGTRQIRHHIRHIIFSSRVCYGVPVFMTITPSERHSGLVIRLYRGRRADPAYTDTAQDLQAWIGCSSPSLQPEEKRTKAGRHV